MLSQAKLPSITFVIFFCLVALQHCTIAIATCHKNDMAGLLAFKSGITADPSGILRTWISGTDCCKWEGVTCGINNRVDVLAVYGRSDDPASSLSGTISSSLSKLRHLTGLYVMDLKYISGTFPTSLLTLKNLLYLYFQNNNLSGPIPPNIDRLRQLQYISLAENQFSGQIPPSISNMTRLAQLRLGGNRLTGTVPVGIKQLKNLQELQLERNSLTGTIPDLSLSKLYSLQLSYNKFSGDIPPTISPLAPTLAYLQLAHNKLSGKIPDFLGKFRALDTLDLSWNSLSGTVPKTFSNLTKIFNLDLSHNHLVDPFPQMYVKGIESLDLSYNQFHLGQIPNWVTSSPIIFSLKLAKCGIKMKLENWKPQRTYFYDFIDLSDNEISGSPIKLLNQTEYLVEFSASGNRLKFNMKNLKFPESLKKLDISRNLVFGNLRKSVSGIQNLDVSHNHLCGPIPATNFSASVFEGNDCLCGSPLSPCKAR